MSGKDNASETLHLRKISINLGNYDRFVLQMRKNRSMGVARFKVQRSQWREPGFEHCALILFEYVRSLSLLKFTQLYECTLGYKQ